MRETAFVLGVAGGSGSGKTYFARALAERLGDKCVILSQDSFYRDQSARFDHDGGSVNFDHPDSLDFRLMAERLEQLKYGTGDVAIPVYDFSTHTRKAEPQILQARPVIIVDGILIFHSAEVRRLLDDTIFFATSEELRFSRRLKRDVEERGRTKDGVLNQFLKQVKPMHDLYVEPSRLFAQCISADPADFPKLLQDYLARLL